MALVLADRVRDTTTTAGTGTVTLSGTAPTGYQTFGAGIGNANTTYYTIAGQTTSEWEVGIGTYTASGTTLSRDTVLASSNAGALVPFSAGTKDVFVTYPAEKSVNQDASGNVGIGTSSPAQPLTLQATTPIIQLVDSNLTTRVANIGGDNGNVTISIDPNGTAAASFFSVDVDNTERMRINSSGNVGIGTTSPSNRLDVQGGNIACSNQILLGSGVNNENCVQIGTGRTGNGFAYIDLVGDTTYTDYGFRMIRSNSGANATSTIDHRGTGSLFIKTSDAAQITFTTNSSDRGAVQSDGRWIFGPYNGSTTSGAVTGVEIKNVSGTGENNVAAMAFHCQAQYATHMYLRADGFFGIGGWSASAWRWYVNMNGGDMTAAGNITAYSDSRLKEDPVQIKSALDITKALTGVRFKWKENSILGHPGTYDYGVMADEVAAVLPEIVHDSMHDAPEGDKYKTVAYDKLIPVLLEAIKELEARVAQLEGK